MEVNMIVGSRIKEERIKRGLSQQALGDLLEVSKVSICGYETGTRTPTMETFLELVKVLDVDPNYLLGRDIKVVCEEEVEYGMKLSKEDIAIIEELKRNKSLYHKLCADPKRMIELINRKLNK